MQSTNTYYNLAGLHTCMQDSLFLSHTNRHKHMANSTPLFLCDVMLFISMPCSLQQSLSRNNAENQLLSLFGSLQAVLQLRAALTEKRYLLHLLATFHLWLQAMLAE